jgi:hypothetical protein
MAWCWAAVLRSWRAARAGLAGFGRTGGAGDRLAEAPESAADSCGDEPAGRCGFSQGRRRSVARRKASHNWGHPSISAKYDRSPVVLAGLRLRLLRHAMRPDMTYRMLTRPSIGADQDEESAMAVVARRAWF